MQATASHSLITEIEKMAQQEIENIRKLSQEKISKKKQENEEKIREIDAKYAAELEAELKKMASAMQGRIEMEKHRIKLKQEELLVNAFIAKAQETMQDLIKDKGRYPDILVGWITEGVLGVSGTKLSVQTSTQEVAFLSPELLKKVSQNVASIQKGREVTLVVDKENIAPSQGIVVVNKEDCLQYSNTIADRMMRHDAQIRQRIFDIIAKA